MTLSEAFLDWQPEHEKQREWSHRAAYDIISHFFLFLPRKQAFFRAFFQEENLLFSSMNKYFSCRLNISKFGAAMVFHDSRRFDRFVLISFWRNIFECNRRTFKSTFNYRQRQILFIRCKSHWFVGDIRKPLLLVGRRSSLACLKVNSAEMNLDRSVESGPRRLRTFIERLIDFPKFLVGLINEPANGSIDRRLFVDGLSFIDGFTACERIPSLQSASHCSTGRRTRSRHSNSFRRDVRRRSEDDHWRHSRLAARKSLRKQSIDSTMEPRTPSPSERQRSEHVEIKMDERRIPSGNHQLRE